MQSAFHWFIILVTEVHTYIQPAGRENKLIGGKWFKFLHNSMRTRSGFSFGNFLLLYFPAKHSCRKWSRKLGGNHKERGRWRRM